MRDGVVLASLEVPQDRRARARGLLGRRELDGAMLLRPARSIHTFGMKFELDVALLDRDDVVVSTFGLKRNRQTLPRFGVRAVLEAERGAFARWNLTVGDELEIREPEPRP